MEHFNKVTTKKQRIFFLILALVLLGGVAFSPIKQGTQRFREIITQTLNVTTSATIQDATLDDAILTDTTITNVTLAGTVTSSSPLGGSGGASFSPNVAIAAPTSIGVSTPVISASTAGGQSNLLQLNVVGTPQVQVGPSGIVTVTGLVGLNGGAVVAPNVVVVAPTAIGTATPAAYINNAGAHNNLVVAKNATPVFVVGNSGSVTGLVLRYGTAGQQLVTGTSLVTGTATASHGLTTVTFALCTLGQDPTAGAGDGALCTVTVSANVVTLKVWQDDFVTAASEQNVDVHWLVVGTP